MYYKINLHTDNGAVNFSDETVLFTSETDSEDARFSLSVGFPEWEDDAYIFLPACVYDGNRFERTRMKYPPMYGASDLGEHPLPLLSDVPALNPDGSGSIINFKDFYYGSTSDKINNSVYMDNKIYGADKLFSIVNLSHT